MVMERGEEDWKKNEGKVKSWLVAYKLYMWMKKKNRILVNWKGSIIILFKIKLQVGLIRSSASDYYNFGLCDIPHVILRTWQMHVYIIRWKTSG